MVCTALALLVSPWGTTSASAAAVPSNAPTPTWQPNGEVFATEFIDSGRAVIGGDFDYVGPKTGGAGRPGLAGASSMPFPKFGGTVTAVAPDGAGGWFVGGSFTMVDGSPRSYLARVTGTGALDPSWQATTVTDPVTALDLAGSTLFVATADTANTTFRIHGIDVATEGPRFPAITSGAVAHTIVAAGSTAYVGGAFTTIGGQLRGRVAQVTDTGSITAFNGDLDGAVHDMVPAGGRLYVGGAFTHAGITPRSRIAALNPVSGMVDGTFDPGTGANDTVRTLAFEGATLYVGGAFSQVRGVGRNRVARLATDGTLDPAFDPPPISGVVNAMHVDGSGVLVGGAFLEIGGMPRRRVARLALGTGTLDLSWLAGAGAPVRVIAPTGSMIPIIGGEFDSVGGVARDNLASIDLASGHAAPWEEGVTFAVRSLASASGVVYVGGTGGGLAARSGYSGESIVAFAPPAVSGGAESVDALTVLGGTTLVVGGSFTLPAPNLTALDLPAGSVKSGWSNGTNQPVLDLAPAGPHVAVAGSFSTINAAPRNGLALVDPSGAVDGFAPDPGQVRRVTSDGAHVYVNRSATQYFQSFRISDDNDMGWNVSSDQPAGVAALDAHLGRIYAVGSFATFGGGGAATLGAVSSSSGGHEWGVTTAPVSTAHDVAVGPAGVLAAGSQGVAFYRMMVSADAIEPVVSLLDVADDSPGNPLDATFVDGSDVFVRTSGGGAAPRFTVRVRAFDRYERLDATYGEVSGLDHVAWGAVPTNIGDWSPNGQLEPGAAQGLRLDCNDAGALMNGAWVGPAIDRKIDYPEAMLPPDRLPALPAQLFVGAGKPYDDPDVASNQYKLVSCRWAGELVTPLDLPGGATTFTGTYDNGMRVKLGEPDGTIGASWNLISEWETGTPSLTTGGSVFGASEARPIVAEWWENSGDAGVVLDWNVDPEASIPEAAFVTRATYERTYEFHAGPNGAGSGSATVNVGARDRAGHDATGVDVQVTIDNTPPVAPQTFTMSPASLDNDQGMVSFELRDASLPDAGAGFDTAWLERRRVDLVNGTCDTGSAGAFADVYTYATPIMTPVTPDVPTVDGCWQYRYRIRDRVGNESTWHPAGHPAGTWLRFDASAPAGGGLTYAVPGEGAPTFAPTVNAPVDPESGIDPSSYRLLRKEATYANGTCGSFPPTGTPVGPSPYGGEAVALTDETCTTFALRAANGVETEWISTWGPVIRTDRTLPNANFVPAPTGFVHGDVDLDVSLADAASGIVSWNIEVDDGTNVTPVCDSTFPAVPAIATTCTWTIDPLLPSGPYDLELTALDAAGNVSTTTTATVYVDNTPPTLDLQLDSFNGHVWEDTSAAEPTFWIRTDQLGAISLETNADDGAGAGISAGGVRMPTDDPIFGPLRSGWNTMDPTGSPLGTGMLTWTAGADTNIGPLLVTATDDVGNTSTAGLEILVDNAPPSPGAFSLVTGGAQPVIELDTAPSDAGGSGVQSTRVERTRHPYSPGTGCDTGTSFPDGAVVVTTWPWTDSGASAAPACYSYVVTTIDNVQFQSSVNVPGEFIVEGPGIVVTPPTSSDVGEAGATNVVGVALRSDPGVDVTVTVTAGPGLRVNGAATTSITFDSGRPWNVTQPVTVSAVDDQRDQTGPPITATVTYVADAAYAGVSNQSTHAIIDDDAAGIELVGVPAGGIAVAEPGTSATYQVRLRSQPFGTVTVLPEGGTGQLLLSGSVAFGAGDWSTPKSITVTAVDDPDLDGPQARTIVHTISTSGDPGDLPYDSVGASIPAVVSDDDAAGLWVTAPSRTDLDEAAPTTTGTTQVSLRARPSGPVTVAITDPTGQVAPAPAMLSFTTANWNVAQSITYAPIADQVAEATPHAARLVLTPASASSAAWAASAPAPIDLTVRDDDAARLVTAPGARWEVDDNGHVLLDELAAQGSILRIRTVGDPAKDVTIKPVVSPASQLVVAPSSQTISAGSHEQWISFNVRAVNDREVESPTHAANVTWNVSSADPLYGAVTMPKTFARITDARQSTLRDTTDPAGDSGSGGSDNGGGSNTGSGSDGTGSGQPTGDTTTYDPPQDPGPRTSGPTSGIPSPPQEEVVEETLDVEEDSGSDRSERREDRRERREARREEEVAIISRPIRRAREWASENKGKAAVAATATASAAVWSAKGAAIAGKALSTAGSGGGFHTPPGLSQLRKLVKLRGARRIARPSRRRRFWRGKVRDLREDDDDDWHDLLWRDDHAA